MTWRNLQLKNKDCTQDTLVLNFFQNKSVRYVGQDREFEKRLQLDANSTNLIAVINRSIWISDLIEFIKTNLSVPTTSFYFGVNRYLVQGNDTTIQFDPVLDSGFSLTALMKNVAESMGYVVEKAGYFDDDQGRHFNFAQPVTYIYGTQRPNL
jgi:hypothetical protein